MKLLTHHSGTYLTGDDIADAVMNYGLTLTRLRDVDLVDIPFLAADQSVSRIELLIGWNNQVTSTTYVEPRDELLEIDTILDLYSRAGASGLVHAEPFTDEQIKHHAWPIFEWNGSTGL